MDFGDTAKWPRPEPADLVRRDGRHILWALTEAKGEGRTGFEAYRVMAHPTMFRTFAEIEDADAAVAFFREYGPIESDFATVFRLKPRDDYRESVELWLTSASRMNLALGLFDALAAKDASRIESLLGQDFKSFEGGIPPGVAFFAQHEAALHTMTLFERAEYAVVGLVNSNLHERVSPRLVRDEGQAGGIGLDLTPLNLLGAMWLLFARTVLGKVIVERCGSCGEWFAMTPESARRGRTYCSDRCKVAAWREKKGGEPD